MSGVIFNNHQAGAGGCLHPSKCTRLEMDIIIVSYNFLSGLYRAIEQYKHSFRRFTEGDGLFQNLSALFPFWSCWDQMFQAVCLKMSYGDAGTELLNEIENLYFCYKSKDLDWKTCRSGRLGYTQNGQAAVTGSQCDFYLGKNAEWDSEFDIPMLQRGGLRAIEDGLPVKYWPIGTRAAGEKPAQPPASRAEIPNKMRAPAAVVSSPAARKSGYVKRGPATYAANHKIWQHSRQSSPGRTSTQMTKDAWYPGHPNKVFLQIGDYPNQENRPVVTSTKPSFISWEEYVTLLGHGLIYEHEYVAGLMKSLADSRNPESD
ncbi:hypothetical protein Asppvi_003313 [Aspergillus pseudoviridinutans]|uniref:Uncharacterized protein n=1 Tax=Aspergillus pseudoviridinutans TaxID=1517512 RepID=A0A9P3B4B0_9EURO|nr:uncharacterized protein Asppvi_003313 [Aspergillus pseudoviridinutans]GIJ84466.1 hypothetical protein Asppvi_003313 [Aspergillus pseudoviridinutans]